MRVDVVTYGETMAVFEGERVGPLRAGSATRLTFAGAESTVAIGVARLGGTSRWVGVLGDDPMGVMITSQLRGEGIDVSSVALHQQPTSLMLKERRTSEHSRVHYYRRDNAGSKLGPEHVLEEDIRSATILHVSGITPALSASAAAAVDRAIAVAAEHGVRICVDVNFRSRLWSATEAAEVLSRMVAAADIVLATTQEASLVTGVETDDPAAAARALAALGPTFVVVKQGSEGAVALVDGEEIVAPAHQVREVDPVGAGDSFAAGLLAELAAGRSPAEALATAGLVAALNVASQGDWEGLATRRELAELRLDADVLR